MDLAGNPGGGECVFGAGAGAAQSGRPKVRTRKTAISSRFTSARGQYSVSEHPAVMPRRASSAIHAANGPAHGTSAKGGVTQGGGAKAAPSRARRRKTAISSRVVARPGQ